MKISANYNIPYMSSARSKNEVSFSSKVTMPALSNISKSAGAVLCLAMIPNIGKSNKERGVVSPLGESLANPSFPEEFCSNGVFVEWAHDLGLRFELKNGAAEFKDKSGNLVRRVVQNKKNKSKVLVDYVWIYENGKEVKKFIKKANGPIKYFYDRTPDEIYMSGAELRSDGYWYDRDDKIMEFNPLTNERQYGFVKEKVYLGESLINPSFPSDFDVEAFKEWANTLGFPEPVIEDGVARFYDCNDRLVRQIKELKVKKGKIQNDEIFIYDNNGDLVGKYSKPYISKTPFYHYGENIEGIFRSIALLREDGFWYPFGRDWEEILPVNPVTGEPQIKKDSEG